MDVNSERRIIIPWRPFPKDNIFDPVRKFDPDQTCEYLKRGAPSEALVQISNFCFRVSALLRHVNTLSWLYVLWSEKMDSTGRTLPEEDKSMTTILIRMHAHIDTGKRFNETSDQRDPSVDATRVHELGFTGVSLDDFRCVNRAKKSTFKSKFKLVFEKWKYRNFEDTFLNPISGVCLTMYQSKIAFPFSLLALILVTDTFFVSHTDITAKLREKGLSVKQVEDWNINVESFAPFPTVPLQFDDKVWKALWPIINKTPLEVRQVVAKLQNEQKEKEMK